MYRDSSSPRGGGKRIDHETDQTDQIYDYCRGIIFVELFLLHHLFAFKQRQLVRWKPYLMHLYFLLNMLIHRMCLEDKWNALHCRICVEAVSNKEVRYFSKCRHSRYSTSNFLFLNHLSLLSFFQNKEIRLARTSAKTDRLLSFDTTRTA
jgi:hypothetical protein